MEDLISIILKDINNIKGDEIMPKLTKLVRSLKAHDRLCEKAVHIPGIKGDILLAYHSDIIAKQIQREELVSKTERKKIYNRIEKAFKEKKR